MSAASVEPCRVLIPTGAFGTGCPQDAFDRGLSLKPHAIAQDAGSTDSGPFYLGTATSKMTRKAIKHDLRQLMIGRAQLGIPLIIGSCGTSGADAGVDWTADICAEIAREEKMSVRVALIYSEQDRGQLSRLLDEGAVTPLPPLGSLTRERLEECDHVVALMGAEPIIAALEGGADIVLAGRSTDTAVIAAMPLLMGASPGAAWHAGKVAECGGLCTTRNRQGGVLVTVDATGFDVEPLHSENTCTPRSVHAHMLYENADPYRLKEPGLVLDVSESTYTQLDTRRVRVEGSRVEQTPYTMKLEGSGAVGYKSMILSGIADPYILENLGTWIDRVRERLLRGIEATLGYPPETFDFRIRAYGWNALDPSGRREGRPVPQEVAVMVLVTAQTQAIADEITKFCNPALLHHPLNVEDPIPSFAFPFSPAEVQLGCHFEFKLNHVVAIQDPLELTRTRFVSFGGEVRHAAA